MSGYIPVVDRQQAVLFPETLDEHIAAENPVRVIDAFVEHLDLGALSVARATPAETGRPGYDPRVLLKLYLYGYLNRVRSSRRLERETHRNIEVLWLLGRATPDHKTISDFRATHATALRGVFREFTVVCRRLDLFGAALVGIDGSKLRAVNAKERSFTPQELRRLLQRIDARLKDYLATLDAADRTEHDPATPRTELRPDLPAKLAQLQTRQQEYQALLGQLEESGAPQVTLTDPESRRMKVKQGMEVCYNAQIAVDAQHHLIVATDVTNAVTDVHQLAPMAEAAKDALGVETLAVAADSGYHHGPGVAQCLAAGITPTVPQPRTSKNARAQLFTKDDFQYLPEQDAYRCPGAAVLPFQFETNRGGEPQRYYYDFTACARCPLRAQCTRTTSPTHGRRIKRWKHEALLEAMAARLAAQPKQMVQRKSLVEHPFGTIKRWDDGSYFLLKGLAKVRGEFSLMALAYNLRRAITILGVPALVAALARRTIPAAGTTGPLPVT
jgi:transposase